MSAKQVSKKDQSTPPNAPVTNPAKDTSGVRHPEKQ